MTKTFAIGLMLAGVSGVAHAQSFNTVNATGTSLVTSTVAAPGTTVSTTAITGLATGDSIVAFDYRPAQRRVLYALSNNGRLYSINPLTAAATQIGVSNFTPVGNVGLDFNPSVDRIRVVTSTGQNVRLTPVPVAATGLSTLAGTDTPLAYAPGQTLTAPTVAGAAYTNTVPAGTPTTLYVIDTRGGAGNAVLATQGSPAGSPTSPNTGQLFAVGTNLGVAADGDVGFDIATAGLGGTNTAYATITNAAGVTSLYSVNLTTGTATVIGALAGNTRYNGLALAPLPFAQIGTTANQRAVGFAFDNFVGTPSADLLALFTAIDSASSGQQAAAFASLTPAAYSLLPEVSLNALETQETNILRYVRDVRGNAVLPDGTTATIDEAGRVGAFLLGGARFGQYDADIDRPEVQNNEYHVMGGLDFRLTPKILIGGFGGYSITDADFSGPGFGAPSKLDAWFAGAYGTLGVGPIYVDLWGSYTDLDWELSRGFAAGTLTGTSRANADGRIYAAGGATGLSFSVGSVEVEPFAALRYADIRINGFGESGSASSLNVGQIDAESLRLNLGGRLGTKFDVGNETLLRVQARGGWLKEFELDEARTYNVNFGNSAIAAPFTFTTTPLSSEYYNAGAAINVAGRGPLSFFADYDVQFDQEREFHALSVGGRLKF